MSSSVFPSAPPVRPAVLGRRAFLHAAIGTAAALGLAACGDDGPSGPKLATADALPTTVPPGTKLTLGASLGTQRSQLELSGLDQGLPFEISSWVNVAHGPDVINAFRAGSLDLATNAGIPPIQAHFQGFDAKIVAINLTRNPNYIFATKPGSEIRSVADFRGKKLAFSQGQAQGVVLLRALKKAGIDYDDVELVPLNGGQFLTALQAGQVDIAPLHLSLAANYFSQYAKDGAREITTDVVDLLQVLWAPASVLADSNRAAAIAAYIPVWAKATSWVYENPERWIQDYYVKTQNIGAEQARKIVELTSKPLFPANWDAAIAWEQETVELLAAGGFVDSFDASTLFDRRFEPLAAAAVSDDYRS